MSRTRDEMAAIAAVEFSDGDYVNLGIASRPWWPTTCPRA